MRNAHRSELLLFFTLLKPAVRRGLPLGSALRRMGDDGGVARGLAEAMAGEIDDGGTLSASLAARPDHFPPPLAAIVRIGEEAGDLVGALDRCTQHVKRRLRTSMHIQAALIYPAVCLLLVGLLAAGYAYMGLHWESYAGWTQFFDERLGPVRSQSRISSAGIALARALGFVLGNSLVRIATTAAALLLLFGLWRLFVSAPGPRRDRLLLNLPLAGRLYRWSAAAGFTRSLGLLLQAGLPVDRAIEASCPAAGNLWVEEALRRGLAQARDGAGLASALSLPGLFPPSLAWRLSVGETRGDMGGALLEAAASYEEDLEVYAGRLARLAEPAAMVLVGAMAMVMAVGIFWPFFRAMQFWSMVL